MRRIINKELSLYLKKFIAPTDNFFEVLTNKIRTEYKEVETVNEFELVNNIYNEYINVCGDNNDKIFRYRDRMQVQILKQKVQYVQRTPAWYKIRNNLITATNIAGIIGSSKYESRDSILKKKLDLTKGFVNNANTEHGKCYEEIAIQLYNRKNNTIINEFGLLKHDTISYLGASPDGITDDGVMVEIKCPTSRIINGNIFDIKTLPYYVQVQTQLEVCDLNICDYLECKIIDYESYEDYMEDGNEFFGSNNMEKGIVGVMVEIKTNEVKYFHTKLAYSKEEKLKDIKTQQSKFTETYKPLENKYWNLKTYSVIQIKRDREFFSKIHPLLEEFWNEVVELKNNTNLYYERYNKRNAPEFKNTKYGGFDITDF